MITSDTSPAHRSSSTPTSDSLQSAKSRLGIAAQNYAHYNPTFGSDLTMPPGEPTSVQSTSSTSRKWVTQWWRSRPPGEIAEAVSGFQKWEGRVVGVDEQFFTAELTPLEGHQHNQTLYGDFEAHLLEPDEVAVGDVVYITARMIEQGHGLPPAKTLSVRLRRLGNWTAEELQKVDEDARRAWEELQDLVE